LRPYSKGSEAMTASDREGMPDGTTVEKYCGNGDGTYNGFKLMQFLHNAVTGKTLSDEEVKKLWDEAKARGPK
jgi:hypothetical protein